MKSADKGGADLEVEELSISSDHDKQDTSDSRTGSEADTAAGKDSHTNSYEDDCFNEMDRRHANKINNVQILWQCRWHVKISGSRKHRQWRKELRRSALQITVMT